MPQSLNADYHQNNDTTEHYSVFFNLFFAFSILGLLSVLCLIFKDILYNITAFFPNFSYGFIVCITFGFIYYVYLILKFKRFVSNETELFYLKNRYLDKNIDLFNFMQIIIGIMGVSTLMITMFDLVDKAKITPVFDNYGILIQPLYIILMCLVGISVLLILSTRITEIISDLYYNNSCVLNPLSPTTFTSSGEPMSDNTPPFQKHTASSQTPPLQTHETALSENISVSDNVTLPHYDNGFLYKKLFELNDNIKHIQRQIIISQNDNINQGAIHTLWDTKIYPFLNNLSERIKILESKFDNNIPQNFQTNNSAPTTADDAIINPVPKEIPAQSAVTSTLTTTDISVANLPVNKENLIKATTISDDDFVATPQQQKNHISDNIKSALDLDDTDDTEETFIQIQPTAQNTKHNDDLKIKIKEKTLDELSQFLEEKMMELYHNSGIKKRLSHTKPI